MIASDVSGGNIGTGEKVLLSFLFLLVPWVTMWFSQGNNKSVWPMKNAAGAHAEDVFIFRCVGCSLVLILSKLRDCEWRQDKEGSGFIFHFFFFFFLLKRYSFPRGGQRDEGRCWNLNWGPHRSKESFLCITLHSLCVLSCFVKWREEFESLQKNWKTNKNKQAEAGTQKSLFTFWHRWDGGAYELIVRLFLIQTVGQFYIVQSTILSLLSSPLLLLGTFLFLNYFFLLFFWTGIVHRKYVPIITLLIPPLGPDHPCDWCHCVLNSTCTGGPCVPTGSHWRIFSVEWRCVPGSWEWRWTMTIPCSMMHKCLKQICIMRYVSISLSLGNEPETFVGHDLG